MLVEDSLGFSHPTTASWFYWADATTTHCPLKYMAGSEKALPLTVAILHRAITGIPFACDLTAYTNRKGTVPTDG
jgi:hypothetical protein